MDICIQLSIASSQGPPHLPPPPLKRGLVLTVSVREIIFSGKVSHTYLVCIGKIIVAKNTGVSLKKSPAVMKFAGILLFRQRHLLATYRQTERQLAVIL